MSNKKSSKGGKGKGKTGPKPQKEEEKSQVGVATGLSWLPLLPPHWWHGVRADRLARALRPPVRSLVGKISSSLAQAPLVQPQPHERVSLVRPYFETVPVEKRSDVLSVDVDAARHKAQGESRLALYVPLPPEEPL